MTRRTEADEQWDRAEQWAAAVIAERIAIDRDDPDWDLMLETARERYIGPRAGPVPDDIDRAYQGMAVYIRRKLRSLERMTGDVQL